MHTALPWNPIWWLNDVWLPQGTSFLRLASILSGCFVRVRSSLPDSLPTWVSTIIAGLRNTSPIITLAVFLPTPGIRTSPSIVSGSPSFARSHSAAFWIDFALDLKKPSECTISSIKPRSAVASPQMSLTLLHSRGVT